MHTFLLILSTAIFFFPAYTAPPLPAEIPVMCGNYWGTEYLPLDPADCIALVSFISHADWATRARYWGISQRPDIVTIPRKGTHRTCEIEIGFNYGHFAGEDLFRLADYEHQMTAIVNKCLLGRGTELPQPAGSFDIGPKKLFFVYLGSIPKPTDRYDGLSRETGRIHRIGNGSEQTM